MTWDTLLRVAAAGHDGGVKDEARLGLSDTAGTLFACGLIGSAVRTAASYGENGASLTWREILDYFGIGVHITDRLAGGEEPEDGYLRELRRIAGLAGGAVAVERAWFDVDDGYGDMLLYRVNGRVRDSPVVKDAETLDLECVRDASRHLAPGRPDRRRLFHAYAEGSPGEGRSSLYVLAAPEQIAVLNERYGAGFA